MSGSSGWGAGGSVGVAAVDASVVAGASGRSSSDGAAPARPAVTTRRRPDRVSFCSKRTADGTK